MSIDSGGAPRAGPPVEEEWVVVLEADGSGRQLDLSTIESLLREVAEAQPISLYTPDRYALQIRVVAATPPAALELALDLWRDALRRLGNPVDKMVRAEVLTPEELQLEVESQRVSEDVRLSELDEVLASSIPDGVGDELLRRALSDSLTGLPCREAFADHIRQTLLAPRAASEQPIGAVLVVDLDRFAGVNRLLGRAGGDRILSAVASRLVQSVRQHDLVARVADDEFAVFVPEPTLEMVPQLARRLVEAVRVPLPDVPGRPGITASVGVALAFPGADSDLLIEEAATAMAAARRAGGDRYEVFPPPARGESGRLSTDHPGLDLTSQSSRQRRA